MGSNSITDWWCKREKENIRNKLQWCRTGAKPKSQPRSHNYPVLYFVLWNRNQQLPSISSQRQRESMSEFRECFQTSWKHTRASLRDQVPCFSNGQPQMLIEGPFLEARDLQPNPVRWYAASSGCHHQDGSQRNGSMHHRIKRERS